MCATRPIECLGLDSLAFWCGGVRSGSAMVLNETEPRVGFISRAATRSSVVFPAPLGPSSATNSPARTSSEIPRKAASDPKRFSTFWNDTPREAGVDGAEVASTGNALRLAPHQVAERLFHAGTFARVVFFADGAGLPAQFQAKNIIFEVVEAAADFVVNIRDGFYRSSRRFLRRGRGSVGCSRRSGTLCRFLRGARSRNVGFGGPSATSRGSSLRAQAQIEENQHT